MGQAVRPGPRPGPGGIVPAGHDGRRAQSGECRPRLGGGRAANGQAHVVAVLPPEDAVRAGDLGGQVIGFAGAQLASVSKGESIADTLKTVSAKSLDLWGVENLTTWVQVGRGRVPRCDTGERWYWVCAYANEDTPDTAEYSVRIGPTEELFAGVGWHYWRVRLGPGPHDVWANILPGGSNAAAIRTLEVWRSELDP